MKDPVPNEVRVQNGPYEVARGFFGYPSLDPHTIQLNGFMSLGLLPSPVLIKEVAYIFDRLIPNLHPHALFGNGTQHGFRGRSCVRVVYEKTLSLASGRLRLLGRSQRDGSLGGEQEESECLLQI